MKKNNKIILLLLIGLTIITVMLVVFNNSKSTLNKAETEFAINDTSNVTKIFIADKKGRQVKLVKQDNGKWNLNDKYEATIELVNLLLYTAKNISVSSVLPKTAHNNIIKRMSVASTKVEFYQKVYFIDFWGIKFFPYEKNTKTYYIGDATMDNMGNFMLMEGAKNVYIVSLPAFRGYVSSRYSCLEIDWRDHTVFSVKLNQIKELKNEIVGKPEESYKLVNVGLRRFDLYRLSDNKKFDYYDTVKIIDQLMLFRRLKYDAIVKDMVQQTKDSIIQFNHFQTITLTETSNKITYVKMYLKPEIIIEDPNNEESIQMVQSKEKFYIVINDSKEMQVAQFYVFEKILQPLSYFVDNYIKK